MKNSPLLLLLMVVLLIGMTGCGTDASAPAPPPENIIPTLPKTGQTTSFQTGDDGDLQKGVAWPGPRFTVSSNGTGTVVTDNLTGLMWTQDGNGPGPVSCLSSGATMTWQEALDHVACLNTNSYLGHSDWRLPNVNELKSLVNYGETDNAAWLNNASQGFSNVQSDYYWSSTTLTPPSNSNAWIVNMPNGQVTNAGKGTAYRVWAVRGGGTGTIALPVTGQTLTYAAGDDGILQRGVAWPSPRFLDNGDDTITDKLTDLMWTKDGNAPGPAGCTPGVKKNNVDALAYVACLNTNAYLGHTDWRMPNVNELASLVNRGMEYPYVWLTAQGFTNVQNHWYRSSTTTASNTSNAWVVMMLNGNMYNNGIKADAADYIWPVRDSR